MTTYVSHPPRVAWGWTKWTKWTGWTKTFTVIDLHIHTPKECFTGNISCLLHKRSDFTARLALLLHIFPRPRIKGIVTHILSVKWFGFKYHTRPASRGL